MDLGFAGSADLRPLNVAKPCSLDFQIWITLQSLCPHLSTDVFPFSIAVRPYK